jgi:hypothetical protein
MSEAGELEGGEVHDRDYEAEARAMGWHPQDEYNGDPAKWVDAKTFVTRGETQLPILRENARKLSQRVRQRDDENADLRQQMSDMRESLTTMRTMMERGQEVGYQRAKAEFEQQMRAAVENGDVATFDRINGEMQRLDEHHEQITKPAAPSPAPKAPEAAAPKGTPEFKVWFDENRDWVEADPTLARAAIEAETGLRNSDEALSEGELWERVTEVVQQKYPRRFAAATGISPGASPPAHQPDASTSRRAPAVLRPSGGAPPSSAKKGGIDSIQDPEERKTARAAFNSIRRSIPEYTEAEYMTVYVNPNADTIAPAIQRKVKANGATH